MSTSIFRIHPAIGLSRVGNSSEYYLAPESIAALPQRGKPGDTTTGGLPIVPGTEDEIITSSFLRGKPVASGDGTGTGTDTRTAEGAFKRQAARFRIFEYPDSAAGVYPAPDGREITIGSKVGDRTVTDIVWTVHVANKKAASFESDDDHGVHAYERGQTPVLRNLTEGLDPYNVLRLRKLVLDAGPRAIRGSDADDVHFDEATPACHGVGGGIVPIDDYPKVFPHTHFPNLDVPQGNIETLGELHTDEHGRLIVAGGHGKSAGWPVDPKPEPEQGKKPEKWPDVELNGPVNNDQWFDDTSDGPVSATIVFDDGTWADNVHGAWVITTDPSYAPQTLNVVSLWDEAYDSFVRNCSLDPEIFSDGTFNDDYRPSFPDQVQPFFKAAEQQLWNTFLPRIAIDAHRAVGAICADDDPNDTIMAGLAYVRQPDPGLLHSWKAQPSDVGAPLMPLSLGDTSAAGGKSFLAPTVLQYFFLERWAANSYEKGEIAELGDGEYLDRASLQNCLGGRFSPGIDIGFVIREPEMYEDWTDGAGPFRIKHEPLDYDQVHANGRYGPFLSLGWLPRHPEVMNRGLQPGDLSKFLALPWHADYNSCAIHQTSPNPLNSNSLYWSWPGQRPVTVYVAADYESGGIDDLPPQRYSVRGPGTMPGEETPTDSEDLANAGRFWDYKDMLTHWDDIGTIIQATRIDDGKTYEDDLYLEVQSKLGPRPELLAPPHAWPLLAGSWTARNPDAPAPPTPSPAAATSRRRMIHDVAIVGGGPAGCATALALRRLGVERVVAVEASGYSAARVGESIPPDTRLLLRDLGLLESFTEQGHERCLGSCSSWGSAELRYNDFVVNPHGDGWHLDRLRFDRWIADHTEQSGADLRRRTSFRDLERGDADRPIELHLAGPGGADSRIRCRFVVDASGQQARVARRLGATPRVEDQLVCVAGYLDAAPGNGLSRLTMLEATEDGWWYAALLPDGRLTAAVASDAAIVNEHRLNHPAAWEDDLRRTIHIGPALADCPLVDGSLRVWSASSTLLDPPAGAGWLAVGDAASAFDPISSQGIHKALVDGLTAAPAIAAWLDGDHEPLTEYRNGIAERFLDYLAMRSYFYGLERRWEDAPFWRHRRAVHPGRRAAGATA